MEIPRREGHFCMKRKRVDEEDAAARFPPPQAYQLPSPSHQASTISYSGSCLNVPLSAAMPLAALQTQHLPVPVSQSWQPFRLAPASGLPVGFWTPQESESSNACATQRSGSTQNATPRELSTLDPPPQRPVPAASPSQRPAPAGHDQHSTPKLLPLSRILNDSTPEGTPPYQGVAHGASTEDPPQPDPETTVCYGMITNISGRCDYSRDLASSFEIRVLSSDRFEAVASPTVQGRIRFEHGPVIQGLLDDSSVIIHGTCSLSHEQPKGKVARGPGQVPCSLSITIYGPLEMFEEVGEWSQGYDVYLQDPAVCHLDVLYCNPHRLSSSDLSRCPMLSEVVGRGGAPLRLEELPRLPDILDCINSHVELEEAPTPSTIRTALKRHQKQALTFIRRREGGWAFAEGRKDMWELIESDHRRMFVNRVSGFHQTEEPERFHGGIVADPMGLGKTLTMIALIASDLDSKESAIDVDGETDSGPTTLVIVPPALLDSWESEFSVHTSDGGPVYRRHHGKTRLCDQSDLKGVNVILSTYHTVSAEWKPACQARNSVLFSIKWRRIILDEAHLIRNGSSRMARAVCDLDGVCRWAVTGTPIQNRLADLASLLRFIRACPYTNPKKFEADVSHLWKTGKEDEAVKRLALLSSCLLLRRPPNTISLPPRRDMLCSVEFSTPERKLYTEAKEQAITKIDEALHQASELSRSAFYVNVLQQIESLRLICDLGTSYHKRKDADGIGYAPAPSLETKWASMAQQTFNVERDLRPVVCLQCAESLETTEGTLDDTFKVQESTALLFSCLRYFCSECTARLNPKNRAPSCGHSPSCPAARVFTSSTDREDITLDPGLLCTHGSEPAGLPSKVEALITDIRQLPLSTKCVVFSTWRMTLDVVAKGLQQADIGAVRFDGKVQQRDRNSVVERFKTDPDVRVMLLTLSCGAVGLTLTVASRAYLLEPHWNPTLEDQALARIYRIGQTKEITTVRFYIRDSFEEEIMKLQRKKKQLAGVILSPHDGESSSGSWDRLHELRRLL